MTVQELLRHAPPDRELFLRYLLKKDRAQFFASLDAPVHPACVARLAALEKKRAAGWPVQYLIGRAWFFGYEFFVTRDVLIPRPETELVVEAACTCVRGSAHKNVVVIDVGTGSGCIAIACAKKFAVHDSDAHACTPRVYATDISRRARAIARRNARAHNVHIRFFVSDVLGRVPWPRVPHLIITANLPYLSTRSLKKIPREVRREPRGALYGGSDGLAVYRKLFADISTRRRHAQTISVIVEIDPEQKTKLARIITHEFPNASLQFIPDLHGDTRVAVVAIG